MIWVLHSGQTCVRFERSLSRYCSMKLKTQKDEHFCVNSPEKLQVGHWNFIKGASQKVYMFIELR